MTGHVRQTAAARTKQKMDTVEATLRRVADEIARDSQSRVDAADEHAYTMQRLARRVSVLVQTDRLAEAAIVAANLSHISRLVSTLLSGAVERQRTARDLLSGCDQD